MTQNRVGGALCLDFVNTVNAWPNPRRDDLTTPQGLARWAAQSGLGLHAPPTPRQLETARRVRQAVRSVFAAIAAGEEPPPEGLTRLLATAGRALPHAQVIQVDNDRCTLAWPAPCTVADLLAAVAVSALLLLHSGPLGRIGDCPSCHWLFLDTSRNGQRRWCDMAVCGAREKSRTYYASTRRHSSRLPGHPQPMTPPT
jgi:predicted RNA-binding Zn ribbon-like protein